MFILVTFYDKCVVKCTLFLAILMLSYVRRWVKLLPLKSPKIGSWKKTFFTDWRSRGVRSLGKKHILQIGEAEVSKFTFMHTLSETKSTLQLNKRLSFYAL